MPMRSTASNPAFDRTGLALGLKSGGYWPGNEKRGLTNHQSTVILFDADTGQPKAMVGGNYLTAVRTAASVVGLHQAHLAREDAKVLGMIGAGHQAAFQLRGPCRTARLRAGDRPGTYHPEMLPTARGDRRRNRPAVRGGRARSSRRRGRRDHLHHLLLRSDPDARTQVTPGTHIACMGTDTKGKQEVDAALVACRHGVFTDEVAQSISIGECQHAIAAGLISEGDITAIGAVINGDHPGRTSADEITLFDGTGVGLQDLAAAQVAVEQAVARGVAITVEV